MKRLLTFIISRPIGVALSLTALVALGCLSLLRLPLTAMPYIARPVIRVQAEIRNESMEQLEAHLAPELEASLMSLPGMDSVTTWCLDGALAADIAFRWGIDEQAARLKTAEAVEGVTSNGVPVRFNTTVEEPGERPAVLFALEGPFPLSERTVLAQEMLVPQLAGLQGVGMVQLLGGERRRTVVRPDALRLATAGVDRSAIRDTLQRRSPNQRIGEVSFDGDRIDVIAEGSGDDPRKVAELSIPRPGAAPVSLRDVASVQIEPWPENGVFLVRGTPTVGIALYLEKGANAIAAGRRIDRALARMGGKLPEGLQLKRMLDAISDLREALKGLATAAGLGALVAGVVLMFFVRRPGPLVVLLLVIPLSLFASIPLFHLLQLELNLISVAGIALAVGMLVDASVVVLEACSRQRGTGAARATGGTLEVGRAIIASAVTTAVVFVPALYMRHLAAALFRELAVAIMVTLVASLCFALLAVPVAAVHLAPDRRLAEPMLTRLYRRALTRLTARSGWALLALAAAGIGSIALFKGLPQHLLAPEARTALEVRFSLPPYAQGPDAARLATRLAPVLCPLRLADEEDLLALGLEARSGPPLPVGFWRLPGSRSLGDLQRIRDVLAMQIPGLSILDSGPAGGVLSALALRALAADVSGADRRAVEAQARRMVPALQEAGFDVLTDLPPLINRIQLAWSRSGMDTPGLDDAITRVLPLREPLAIGDLRLAESAPGVPELQGIKIALGDGATAPLGSLVSASALMHPPALVRRQGEPAVRLLLGRPTGEVRRIEKQIKTIETSLPAGIRVKATGGILDWQDARQELLLALCFGLALVFLVLTAIYESFRLPLVVFCVLPFAFGGAALGLRITGHGLDLASGLGLVLLGGLAVNNGVLLTDRLHGCVRGPARMSRAASARLRPVMVTTFTTLATLGPLAFMGGTGASLRATLALTLFFGLLVSTPAALFVLPPLARIFLPRSAPARGPAPPKGDPHP